MIQMRPLFLLTLCFAVLSGSLHAQTSLLPNRQSEVLSPSENRFDTHAKSMDSRQYNQLYANPVMWLSLCIPLERAVRKQFIGRCR